MPLTYHQPHLFPAHRLYIWAYEKALREECGYKGWQPVSLLQSLNSNLLTDEVYDSTGTGAAQLQTQPRRLSSMATCPAWAAMVSSQTTPVYPPWLSRRLMI